MPDVKSIKSILGDIDEEWKQSVVTLLLSAVEDDGITGLQHALNDIEALAKGQTPQIDFSNLGAASTIVAKMQNAEADEKSAVQDWIVKVSDILGNVIQGILKGLIS